MHKTHGIQSFNGTAKLRLFLLSSQLRSNWHKGQRIVVCCPRGKALLKLVNIAKKFGPRLLFKGICLDIQPGITLLAGANGAGKSTLMRIMAGLCHPDTGTVNCVFPLEKIGYLAHAPFVYPALSALENLSFWAGIMQARKSRQDLMDVLALVRLERFAHDRAGIFSRGMAQRLNLARLLLAKPQLLLLDEPGTGLDTSSRQLLRSCVLQAQEEGSTIVWISHDVEADCPMAREVLWLEKKGVRVEAGGQLC